MNGYSRQLGDSIRKARISMDLTQYQLTDAVGIDPRTILNIENHKGNPKMEVLYPLIRTLNIDANELFYPEQESTSQTINHIHRIISDCTESEADTLLPIIQSVLSALRTNDAKSIE